MHKGFVHPRYDSEWYRRNHTSCFDRGAAFGVASFLNVGPAMLLWHFRPLFSARPLRFPVSVLLRKVLLDSAGPSLAAGSFLGVYCSLNNWVGAASVVTACTSAALTASFLALGRPKMMPVFSLAGVAVAGSLWYGTWVLQTLA